MKKLSLILTLLFLSTFTFAQLAESAEADHANLNKAERLEWFKDLGFGMFIHFSFDSQLGVVISHSMAGASNDYLDRFVNELPKTFNPKDFDPVEIATRAKLAGMKYIVFTTKHHSGFCMWDTETTDFKITNTPYQKDLLAEYVQATRDAGLGVGFYYSPEDFNFLYENGQNVRRRFNKPIPADIMKKYLELNELQCMELMAKYGDIDVIFFDGGEGALQEKCKHIVWELQPNIVVTRGAIKTPEQKILGIVSDEPWEACITMGTQWAYKPTNENYKTGARLIELLIETRARGGNLLLNVGPKHTGALPEAQEQNLMEMAAWNFVNHEAIEKVSSWILSNEENIWYTWKPEEKTLYAILTKIPNWKRGDRKEFILKSVLTSKNTEVSVLGQSSKLVEYNPQADATTYFEQKEDGLHVSCVRAQRIYNNHKWHNPIVIKITNAAPALDPPVVSTDKTEVTKIGASDRLMLHGQVNSTGDAASAKVGFQYREYVSLVDGGLSNKWKETLTKEISEGNFEFKAPVTKEGKIYEYRAFIDHPKLRVFGDTKRVTF